MQPLPIISDVSMNLDQGDVYNIMWYKDNSKNNFNL